MENNGQESLQKILESLPKSSPKEWYALITKDLKGKSIEDLAWHIDQNLKISPFATKAKQNVASSANRTFEKIQWQNGAAFSISNKNINDQILTSLNGGCENILFYNCPEEHDLTDALENVHIGMVGLHFLDVPVNIITNCVRAIQDVQNKQGLENSELAGSIRYRFNIESNIDQFLEWHSNIKSAFPYFKTIELAFGAPDINDPNWIEETTEAFGIYIQALSELDDSKVQEILSSTILRIHLSNHYLRELVRVQTLKIIWQNILAASNLKYDDQTIEIVIIPTEPNLSKEDFMIESSTMALSSALAGADRIVIQPASINNTDEDNLLRRRASMNVHHILKYESFLENYSNPLIGSYFFEKAIASATDQIWSGIIDD